MSTPHTADNPSPHAFTVTHRSVLVIAVPMTLGYLSTPLLGVVDMAVIGRLGDATLLGGIALGGIIFDLVFTTFNFLRARNDRPDGASGWSEKRPGNQGNPPESPRDRRAWRACRHIASRAYPRCGSMVPGRQRRWFSQPPAVTSTYAS